jgi:hypothetical protein
MSHPVVAYTEFKENKKAKMSVSIVLLIIAAIVSMIQYVYTGPVLNVNDPTKFNSVTTIIYTIWFVITAFIKLVNNTINSGSEKQIPDYVIPTPVDKVSLFNTNDALVSSLAPINNVTYIEDGKSLYERFTRGEDLSSEQYKIVKEYLMTR